MADNETKKTHEETRSFLKNLIDKLSAMDDGSEKVQENQRHTVNKMAAFHDAMSRNLTDLNKTSYHQLLFLTQIERVSRHTADNMLNSTLALNKMLPFIAQIADNVYNITARIAGNQVTSMKETIEAIGEQQVSMYKKTLGGFTQDDLKKIKGDKDEGAELEKQREAAGIEKGIEEKEKKAESFWDKLGKFFEFVLIPVIAGFAIGLSKSLGLFESGLGKLVTLFAVMYTVFGGFRKAVNSLVINLTKKGLELIRGKAAGTVADAAKAGVPAGVPGKPGTVEGPVVKQPKGPSGLDKFLENAKKIGKSLKDLFVGIADTIAKVLGKLAGGIKELISKVSEGIKNLLQNIAKGIESFGKGNVLKGAAALVVVSGALFVAAKAFKEFADVKWESVAKGLVGITGLVVVMKLLEKVTGSIIKGAAALTIMSGALFVAGKAFQQFANVDWQTLAVAAVGIGGLAAALMLLGPLIVPITLGAAALGVMSLALAGFGAAVQVLAAGLPTITEFIEKISTIDGVGLLAAAAGITAIGVALAALGAGQVVQAIGNFVSSILSFGKDDIFTKLTRLGEVAGDLNQLPATIESLGKLSNFKVSSDFMKNVDMLSAGLEKIATSAKGFEKTGDSLNPLAKIAEVMNKPAPGAAGPAGGPQPAAAGPAAQPAAKPAGGSNAVYSKEDIAAAERHLAMAEKSGSKAAISGARSRLQNMKSQNKMADSLEPAKTTGSPEPKGKLSGFTIAAHKDEIEAETNKLIAEGTDPSDAREEAILTVKARKAKITPVPTGVPGQALNQESQKVAGASGGPGGTSQNVVAPVTTTNVNQSQTQNLSVKPSATPTFGSWQSSFYNLGLAGQRPVF